MNFRDKIPYTLPVCQVSIHLRGTIVLYGGFVSALFDPVEGPFHGLFPPKIAAFPILCGHGRLPGLVSSPVRMQFLQSRPEADG